MKIIVLLLLIINFKIFPEDLKINTTYDNKPYKLYSIYSYDGKEEQPFGALGKNLGKILKGDDSAMWEFRKYQIAKITGSTAMVAGILSMFFNDFKLTKSGKIGINVIAGATVIAIGYGIGYNYANYSLKNAVKIFNENKKNNNLSFTLFPDSNFSGLVFNVLFNKSF